MKFSASVALKYGVFIALALVIYFLVLKLVGLHNNPWFRILNGPIMIYGIYLAIKNFKNGNSEFDYGRGFKTGLLTGFFGTVLFSFFMCMYMFYFDTQFTKDLLENWFSNFDYGGGILVFIILIEGLTSTLVMTLACMQLLKNSRNIIQNK